MPLLLFILFLFPQVEKSLHDFEHQDDSKCFSTEKHFHSQEHTCSLCDYTVSSPNITTDDQSEVIRISYPFSYHLFCESTLLSRIDYKFSPRAPPALS